MVFIAGFRLENSYRRDAALPFPKTRIMAGILVAGLLVGCVSDRSSSQLTARIETSSAHSLSGDTEVSIGVINEGWHTGLILPTEALGPSLAGLRYRFPDAKYLVFGWGNRNFYETANPGMRMAVASLFPSASVVLVQGFSKPPQQERAPGADIRWLCISSAGTHRLDVFLDGYLQKDGRGEPVSVQPGPMPNSEFFASTGTYDAFHTCNTWTVEALRASGLPVSDSGIIFARQVMSEIRFLQACSRRVR